MLETIAHQCAQALERARLLETEAEARRELTLQKAILEAEGEASADGILLVSPDGRMLSFNRRFVELWELPEEVVASRSDAAALEAIEAKLAEPQEFYDRVALPVREPRRAEPRRDRAGRRPHPRALQLPGPAAPRASSSAASGTSATSPSCGAARRSPPCSRQPATCSPRPPRSRSCSSSSSACPFPRLVGICTAVPARRGGRRPGSPPSRTGTPSRRRPSASCTAASRPARRARSCVRCGRKESVRLPALDREALRRTAQSEEHLELMEPFASRAAMMVPLVAHGLTYGVLGVGTAPRRDGAHGPEAAVRRGARAPDRDRARQRAPVRRGRAARRRGPLARARRPTASCSSTAKTGSATGTRPPPSCSGWTATSSAGR